MIDLSDKTILQTDSSFQYHGTLGIIQFSCPGVFYANLGSA